MYKITLTEIMFDELSKYESTNYKLYIGAEERLNDEQANKLILTSEKSAEIKETCYHITSNMRNPYIDYYHWCKSELNDVKAMTEAIVGRDSIKNHRERILQRRTNCANSLRAA